jgi:hypothetical protein
MLDFAAAGGGPPAEAPHGENAAVAAVMAATAAFDKLRQELGVVRTAVAEVHL